MSSELYDEVKAIVADPTKAPQLHDVIHAEASVLIERMHDQSFDPRAPYSDEELVRRVTALEQASAGLARAAALIGYFGNPGDRRTIPSLISRLASPATRKEGQEVWLSLDRYPALLVLYVTGLAAVAGSREEALGPLFLTSGRPDARQVPQPNILSLYPEAVLEKRFAHRLPALDRHYTPVSDRLHEVTQPFLAGLVFDEASFDLVFDRFELLLGLVIFDLERGDDDRGGWGPIGRFVWRTMHGAAVATLWSELEDPVPGVPLLRSGLFRGDPTRMAVSAAAYRAFVARARLL